MNWAKPLLELQGRNQIFRDFVTMAACALSAGTREPEYMELARTYKAAELQLICEAFGNLIHSLSLESWGAWRTLPSYRWPFAARVASDQAPEIQQPTAEEVMEILAQASKTGQFNLFG